MTALENLGRVNESHHGYQELFRRGDEYIVVSTVEDFGGLSPAQQAIVGIAGVLGGYATSGEETMAFPASEDGTITDWGEIAVATGDGSRERVLEELGGVTAS